MNKNEILNSIDLKEHFTQISGTPLAVMEEPYFTQRLETLEAVYGCKSKFETYVKELARFESADQYHDHYRSVFAKAAGAIAADAKFKDFLNDCYKKDHGADSYDTMEYVDACSGDTVEIIISMKDPYFTALAYAVPGIFNGAKTAAEFIAGFTDLKHIIYGENTYSKIWSCFKSAPTGILQKYVYHLLNIVARHISKSLNIEIGYIQGNTISIVVDEKNCITLAEVTEAIKGCPDGIGDIVTVEMQKTFFLDTGLNTEIYRFNSSTGKEECVSPLNPYANNDALIPLMIKYYYNQKITDDDLVFGYDYSLAKFLEPIDNPW